MAFHFSAASTGVPKLTRVFVGATVKDQGKPKKVITSKNEIKIRLQGIDTPELHFPVIGKIRPEKKSFGNEFRQPLGAGAANALHEHLKLLAGGATVIPATLVTRINLPNDATDSHGRFVGDIIVGVTSPHSINTWLVENGWAHPLFYDSMTPGEIQELLKAWNTGKTKNGRPGKSFVKDLQPFDPKLNANNAALPDGGKVNFPKLFRRQATFWSQVAGPLTGAEFAHMIGAGVPGKPDKAYPTSYFLANYDKLDPKKRVRLASKIGAQGQALFTPPDLVFKEDAATLLDANGDPVKSWG
jgi:endonuclease YncB( thermonuclease family)